MAQNAAAKAIPDSGKADVSIILDDPYMRRTAGWQQVMYHSITGMVGAGVLGMPAVFTHLGWPGGIIMLLFSLWCSWYTYKLLVYMHEVPDLDNKAGQGVRRLDRYDELAAYVFGRHGKLALLPFQLIVLVGVSITFTVIGGDSLHAVVGLLNPAAQQPKWVFYIVFGGIQLFLSLLPSFNELSLVSLVGACMSVAYCTIAVAMSATIRPAPGTVNYDPAAVQRTPLEKAMGIFNALTTILFAYGGHNVALEIQATLPINEKHPSTVPRMMRGVNVTFIITGCCYFLVSIMGFWAFGTSVADNVLLTFSKGPNSWVVAMADLMVVLHVAAAYQFYTQPVFQLIDYRIKKTTGHPHVNPYLQTGIRLFYVVCITIVGIVIPFFGSLMGLFGAIGITPTTFLLPPLLWLMYKKPEKFSMAWWVNWSLVIITGIIGILGCVGALYGIIAASSTYRVFAA